ncbi:MAG: phenylalanine--tRNA ligase subunit beta [Candidatus Cloacimonadia bacterium]
MKISYNWLKDFVRLTRPIEEYCNELTIFGLEVESITSQEEKYENIVAGKVFSISPHPRTKHLKVCQVDIGSGKTLSIVCGAPNIKEDIIVPVAKVGACIEGKPISQIEIHDVLSLGMICSEKELGISEDHSGVMVLPENISPGTPIKKALHLDDTIIEVEVTPNRPDLLGMFGIAREVAAMLNTTYSKPKISFNETQPPTEKFISVEIQNPDLCPRYCARLVKNITLKPSPLWIQARLRACGLRPINNVVDITNYVMLEYGQPIHAFDFDQIAQHKIIIRTAKEGEKITLLNGNEYTLNSENLLITDPEKPIALAGIMGSSYSSILPTTKNVIIECAYFKPQNIRKSSISLGVSTDASYRYERGTEPNRLEEIVNRVAQLIQETAGGEICQDIVDKYPKKILPPTISLRPERVNKILATQLTTPEICSYLERFEFTINEKEDILSVTAPTFRPDIKEEIDLIEEIARAYGYQNIISPYFIPHIENRWQNRTFRKILTHLVEIGFFEVCNLSFTSPSYFDKLLLPSEDPRRQAIELANPPGEHFSILRTSLIPNLLNNAALNLSQNYEDFKLFELNKVYWAEDADLTFEPYFLTGIIVGNASPFHWTQKSEESSFFDVKGIIESLLKILRVENVRFISSREPFYLQDQAAEIIVNDTSVGSLGVLNQEVCRNFDIGPSVRLFNLNITKLLQLIPKTEKTYSPLIKFPPLTRDIALISPADLSAAEIESAIRSVKPDIIKDVKLFDVFTGKQIKKGFRSLAFHITFQSPKQTLTDEYVDKLFDKIIKKLQTELKIEVRQK